MSNKGEATVCLDPLHHDIYYPSGNYVRYVPPRPTVHVPVHLGVHYTPPTQRRFSGRRIGPQPYPYPVRPQNPYNGYKGLSLAGRPVWRFDR